MNTGVCLVGVARIVHARCGRACSPARSSATPRSITASAISQDLDLGNYPLYAGVERVPARREYVAASDTSVTKLTGTSSAT